MRCCVQLRLLAVLVLWLAVAALSAAQEDLIAFGDSITEGPFPFDEENLGGYPARLQDILRDEGLQGVRVFNDGRSGERTAGGLSRIDSVLANRDSAGTLLLMEGTNDISRIALGEFSLETTVQNLEVMAAKARGKALDVIYATIIPRPPWARLDSDNALTFGLIFELRELTSSGNRPIAEIWEALILDGAGYYDRHYYCCDPVGHPDASGFDIIARTFADKILEIDNLAPIVTLFFKTGDPFAAAPGDALEAILHESGSGIDKNETVFTVNGRDVDTTIAGSKRRLNMSYTLTGRDIECGSRVTIRTQDAAEPVNGRNRVVGEYEDSDSIRLDGDVNGDCRVDGLDLTLFGPSFGSRFGDIAFSSFADANNDRKVDGRDLARLARNFGKEASD